VTDSPRRHPLRFGAFEADLDAGELRKRGLRVRVSHQAFRVLQLLIENPMRVISREELRRTLWAADTFVEFDHGLNNAISRLREALDDSSTNPRFIETLPRRGYRFITPVEPVGPAPVERVEPKPDATPAAVPPVLAARRTGSRVGLVLGAAATLALIVAGLVWWLAASPVPALRSLAVLPLVYKGVGDQPGQAYLADGMTDALITELSTISALQVISATSSSRYKGTTKSLPEIARELGVDAVVEGSVLREGSVIRVTVQLIRADTDTHLLTRTYTRPVGNILALQSEVALAIAHEIGARLTPQEETRIARSDSVDPEAYRLYVVGNQLRGQWTEPELRMALDHFEQALKIEPDFARAFWGISETWIAMAGFNAYVPPRQGFPKAKAAARQAVAIDDSLAEAHSALAFVSEVYDRDFKAAEQSYQRAISLSPNDALAHRRYSLYLNRTGRNKEGVLEAERAYDLDPLSVENNISLGMRLFSDGRQEQGIEAMLRAAELNPTHFDIWVHLGDAYRRMGRAEDAIAAVERGVELSRRAPHALHMLASTYFHLGKRAEAEALVQQLEQSPRRNAYELAMIRLDMGHADRAVSWLLTACEERTPQMAFFQFDRDRPTFEPLRRDARFNDILRCAETVKR
jgi:TolB-like protein/DNA-binding winged helix-turn-helix (wHTH) protein/Tfp pilus assembly protein PilF